MSDTWRNVAVVTGESFSNFEAAADAVSRENPLLSFFDLVPYTGARYLADYNQGGPLIALPEYTSLRAGCWVRVQSWSANRGLFVLRDAARGARWYVFHHNERRLLYMNDRSQVPPSGAISALTTGIYQHLEWMHLGLALNGSLAAFYLNGQEIMQGTIPPLPAEQQAVYLHVLDSGSTTTTIATDDIYVDVSLQNVPLAPPPNLRFVPRVPVSAGEHRAWTTFAEPGRSLPFDARVPPDTRRYLAAQSAGQQSTFRFGPYRHYAGHVEVGAALIAYANRHGQALAALVDNGSAQEAQTFDAVGDPATSAWWAYTKLFHRDPAGDPWTPQAVRDSEMGVMSE